MSHVKELNVFIGNIVIQTNMSGQTVACQFGWDENVQLTDGTSNIDVFHQHLTNER